MIENIFDEILYSLNGWRGLEVTEIRVDQETYYNLLSSALEKVNNKVELSGLWCTLYGYPLERDETVPGFEIVGFANRPDLIL